MGSEEFLKEQWSKLKIDYDNVSNVYDSVRHGYRHIVEIFVKKCRLERSSRVLEIGCGTGNHMYLLGEKVSSEIHGVDPSLGMLRKAKAKGLSFHFLVAMAGRLPYREAVFDLVFMIDVIHHIRVVDPVLKEGYRVLDGGGCFCIVTQSRDQIRRRFIARYFPSTVKVDLVRYQPIETLVRKLMGVGFVDLESFETVGPSRRVDASYLSLVEMRGWSMLQLIREDEFRRGLESLKKDIESREMTWRDASTVILARK